MDKLGEHLASRAEVEDLKRCIRKLEKELKEWKEFPYAKVGEYHKKWLGEK